MTDIPAGSPLGELIQRFAPGVSQEAFAQLLQPGAKYQQIGNIGGSSVSLPITSFVQGTDGTVTVQAPTDWVVTKLTETGVTSTLTGRTLVFTTTAVASGTVKLRAQSPDNRQAAENTINVSIIPSSVIPPTPTQHQLVTDFCGIPNGSDVALGSYVRALGRTGHRAPRVSVSRLKAVDVAFALATPGTESARGTANITLQRAFEVGGTTVVTAAKSLTPGGLVTSDEAPGLTVQPSTMFYLRWEGSVPASTDVFPSIALNAPSSRGFRTNGASQLSGTGDLNNSGTGSGPVIWPALVLGVPSVPLASVLCYGDSIPLYLSDTNTPDTQGFLTRAMANVAGSPVPFCKAAVNGNQLAKQSMANAPLQKQLLPFVTDLFIHLGTNDIGNLTGSTDAEKLAQLQAMFTDIAQGARAVIGPYGKRIRIHASTIIPRGPFSNSQNTIRTNYNAWLLAGAGGLVDKGYDLEAAAGDPNDSTNYNTDRIHPLSDAHARMGAVVSAGFVPYLDPYYGV